MIDAAHYNAIVHTNVVYNDDARQKIRYGIDMLADAVCVTLGPRGRNVVIDVNEDRKPIVTKDGATVASVINPRDRYASIGVQLLRDAALMTANAVGDGTTTATVLARAMYVDGQKLISAGHDPMALKRGMEMATDDACSALLALATRIGLDDVRHVATISANGDSDVGSLIERALCHVEPNAVHIERARGATTDVDIITGMRLNAGLASSYLVTDSDRMIAEINDPIVLIADTRMSMAQDVIPMLELAAQRQRSLLLIVAEIDGEALQTVVINKLRNTVACCAIRAPYTSKLQYDVLCDISTFVGVELITPAKHIESANVGSCKKAIVGRNVTTIIPHAFNDDHAERMQSRIRSITQCADADAHANERIASLQGKLAIINVGGRTDAEVGERYDRVDDALNAARSALTDGIVPGGGCTLARVGHAIAFQIDAHTDDSVLCGYNIVKRSLIAPIKQMLINAGIEPAPIINDVINTGHNAVFDIMQNRLCVINVDSHVIDPVAVCRTALLNAVSVAGLMLTIDAAIAIDE